MPRDSQVNRLLLGSPLSAPRGYGGGGDITSLLLEQGRQQADAARAQGEIWSGAFQQAGQQIAGGFQQVAEEKKLKARDAKWLSVINDPEVMKDPRKAYAASQELFGPEGDKHFQSLVAMHQLAQPKSNPEADGKAAVAVYQGLKGMTPEFRAETWPQVRATMGMKYPKVPLPEQYDEKHWNGVVVPMFEGGQPEKAPIRLGKDDILLDPDTKKPIYEPPPAEPKPDARGLDVQAADALARGDRPTYERLLKVKKEMGQADDRPRIVIPPQPQWTDAEDAQGNPVLVDKASGQVKAYPGGAMPKAGAAEANRIAAADAALNSSAQLKDYLSKPEVRAAIGPAMGRFKSLEQAAGAGDPVAVELVAMLKSYSALQPQIHGFRNVHFAQDIEKLLSTHQTPESLEAALRGIDSAAVNVRDRRRAPQGAAPAAPSKNPFR